MADCTERRNETDLASMLAGIADRLRIHAVALRGLAADLFDADSIEGCVKVALAADLDDVASRIDLAPDALCQRCRTLDIVELFRVERSSAPNASEASTEPARAKPSQPHRRRPRSRR